MRYRRAETRSFAHDNRVALAWAYALKRHPASQQDARFPRMTRGCPRGLESVRTACSPKPRESLLSTPRLSQVWGTTERTRTEASFAEVGHNDAGAGSPGIGDAPSRTGSVPIESGSGADWTCMQARPQSRLGGRGHRLKFLLIGARWRSRSDSSTECFRAWTQIRGDLGFRDTVL